MESVLVSNMARKLDIQDNMIVLKASEFDRLAMLSQSGGPVMDGHRRAVLCLDLASSVMKASLNQEECRRLIGCPKRQYNNLLSHLRRQLNLDSLCSLTALAVQFNCTQLQEPAEKLLDRYRDQHCRSGETQINPSLLNITALFALCRKHKVKVVKSSLVDLAGCKTRLFDNMVTEMTRLAEGLEVTHSKSRQKKDQRPDFYASLSDRLEKVTAETDAELAGVTSTERSRSEAESEESYDEWRTRILTQAYAALDRQYVPGRKFHETT